MKIEKISVRVPTGRRWKLTLRAPLAALTLTAGCLLLSLSLSQGGALKTNGRFFQDAFGRAVVLRGVTVAGNARVPPFVGITSAAQLDPLPAWGINVIRLIFTWEAYETAPGQYNDAYLAYLNNVVDLAWQRGIYVVIDFHQGGYARRICGGCGNGFPSWAIPPTASLDLPDNGVNCTNWLFTKAINDPDLYSSFSLFFANTYGVRTRFLQAWSRLAQNFASRPGVIGYDLLNEPWGSEPAELAPLYEDLALTIRAADPTAILFVEPQIFVGNGTQTRLPKPTFANFAYAPHYYDPTVLFQSGWNGDPTRTNTAFSNMEAKAAEWNVPLWVGEYGGPAPAARIGEYLDLVHSRLNGILASGAQWGYTPAWTPQGLDGHNGEDLSIADDAGRLRANYRVRPYAQKIAGLPTQLAVSNDGRSIELRWTHDRRTGWTEIFAPRSTLFGSSPIKIEKEGASLSCGYDPTQTKLRCVSSVDGPKRVLLRVCNAGAESCS